MTPVCLHCGAELTAIFLEHDGHTYWLDYVSLGERESWLWWRANVREVKIEQLRLRCTFCMCVLPVHYETRRLVDLRDPIYLFYPSPEARMEANL